MNSIGVYLTNEKEYKKKQNKTNNNNKPKPKNTNEYKPSFWKSLLATIPHCQIIYLNSLSLYAAHTSLLCNLCNQTDMFKHLGNTHLVVVD